MNTTDKQKNNITLKKLVLFLPMDENVRAQTLKQLETITPDQKLKLSRLLWNTFFEYFRNKVNFEFQNALADAQKGKQKLHSKLYPEIRTKVQEEFAQKLSQFEDTSQIENVRKELSEIIKTKKPPVEKVFIGTSHR